MKTKAKKSAALTRKLAELRKTEHNARRQRLELLKRDLKRADVKLCFCRRPDDVDSYGHPRSKGLRIYWLNGPCQPDEFGDYTDFTAPYEFKRFVAEHYDGLSLRTGYKDEDDEAEELFSCLLERIEGYLAIPPSVDEVDDEDEDEDDEDEDDEDDE